MDIIVFVSNIFGKKRVFVQISWTEQYTRIITYRCDFSLAFYRGKRAILRQHKIYTDTNNTMKLFIEELFLQGILIQHLSPKKFIQLTTKIFECKSALYDLAQDLDTITIEAEFPLEMKHIYATIVGLQGGWNKGHKIYETLVIRFTPLIDMMNQNCAAVYSVQCKDALTKKDPIIQSLEEININRKETLLLHNSDTCLLCMVNSWTTVVEYWVSEFSTIVFGIISDFNYPVVSTDIF